MYGSDSCLERCRALNKLHRNFLVFMLLSEGHNILHYPRSLNVAQAELPGGSHKHLQSIALSQFPCLLPHLSSLLALKLLCLSFYTPFWKIYIYICTLVLQHQTGWGEIISELDFPTRHFPHSPRKKQGFQGKRYKRATEGRRAGCWASSGPGSGDRPSRAGRPAGASAAQSPAHKLAALSRRLQRWSCCASGRPGVIIMRILTGY